MEFGFEYINKKIFNLNYNFQDFYVIKILIMLIYVLYICVDYIYVYMYVIFMLMFNIEVVQYLVLLIDNQEYV